MQVYIRYKIWLFNLFWLWHLFFFQNLCFYKYVNFSSYMGIFTRSMKYVYFIGGKSDRGDAEEILADGING